MSILQRCPLFDGTGEKEIAAILRCLSSFTVDYTRNQFILHAGVNTGDVGLVLSGGVHIIQEDFWGNRNLLSEAVPGQLFAETYACIPGAVLGVSVIATGPTTVMFLNVRRILTTCTPTCEYHARLIRNLLTVLAEKNQLMNSKLTHMAQRTTREKLLSYLSSEAIRQKNPVFDIPFNRQQLADYLSVDRSAMSKELCKMRDGGLLEFSKNHFELKDQPQTRDA